MAYGSVYDQILAATGKGTANYSFYAVPLMWLLNMVPHFLAILVFSGGKFTNVSPRAYVAEVHGKEKKNGNDKMLIRAESCQMNGFENIGWFAAAVTAGNVAKLPAEQLNALAFGYLATRVAYTVLYLGVTNEVFSYLRSGAYVSGVAINATLFIRAAKALQ